MIQFLARLINCGELFKHNYKSLIIIGTTMNAITKLLNFSVSAYDAMIFRLSVWY